MSGHNLSQCADDARKSEQSSMPDQVETCEGLWRSKSESAGKYGICTSHSVYILLQSKYGVDRKKGIKI